MLKYGKVIKTSEKSEVLSMAKKVSSKKPMFGNNRPFSLKTTRKVQKVNMQTVTVNGEKVRMSERKEKNYKNSTEKAA